jgi:hypothetical protein
MNLGNDHKHFKDLLSCLKGKASVTGRCEKKEASVKHEAELA